MIHLSKTKITIVSFAVALLMIGTILLLTKTDITPTLNLTPETKISPTPEVKPVTIETKVTPWGDMYRKEPDCKQDFSVELFSQNASLAKDEFQIVFHAGAFYWIVEKAYYTSDLFSGQRWIDISKTQYTTDLQKTFTFKLTNLPEGSHYLTLTLIFHEGTRNNATALFSTNGLV